MRRVKRILLLTCTISNRNATGITLGNLLSDYPKDHILIAAGFKEIQNMHANTTKSVYSMGRDEYRHLFPLSLVYKKHYSGVYNLDEKAKDNSSTSESKSQRLQFCIFRLVVNFFHFIGLYHYLYRCVLSEKFMKWLDEYKPDIIYTMLSTRASISIANQVADYLGIPICVHIMDDWPMTIIKKGLCRKYWKAKIGSELNDIILKAKKRIAISELMATEYKIRYNAPWLFFHNPVNLSFWRAKRTPKNRESGYQITYSGRIGVGIYQSLLDIIKAVDLLVKQGMPISFIVQTRTPGIISRIKTKYLFLEIREYIPYNQLANFFANSDLMVIPYAFKGRDHNFIRYSMPTKASEYMASGTPVLYYGPKDTALFHFFEKHRCAHTISEPQIEKLVIEIKKMLQDKPLRDYYADNALNTASRLFDQDHISSWFCREICE